MPTLHLGDRSRHFKQLQLLQRHRLARRNDPLSAYQHETHAIALLLLHEILTQGWSILLFQRRFFQTRQSYTEFIPNCEVVGKLLAALEAYEKCLTHQAFYDPRGVVKYDLEEFEQRLFGAVAALHSLGSTSLKSVSSSGIASWKICPLRYVVVRGPVGTGWMCTREGETWRADMDILLDPAKGKLKVREWEYEEVGFLVDGLISINFLDGEGEDAAKLELGEALPKELMDHFAQAGDQDMREGVAFDMGALVTENERPSKMKSSRPNPLSRPKAAVAKTSLLCPSSQFPSACGFAEEPPGWP